VRENVLTTARKLGLDVRVRSTETPARTVPAAAAAAGCEEDRVARTEVFVADGDPVAVVCLATDVVDRERLCALLDCAVIRPASAGEVRAVSGFAAGSVCMIGHELPLVLDEALMERERVWTTAGDANSLVEVPTRALADRLGATVGRVASRNGNVT
jgi:prolyl-tRNA editing enzyme YbaK/EbsC (Cys-tRNA(Pro) deacylase)